MGKMTDFGRLSFVLWVGVAATAPAQGARKEPTTFVCSEIRDRTPLKCLAAQTAVLAEGSQISAWTQFRFESSLRPVQHVWSFEGQEVSRRTLTPTSLGWRGVTSVSTRDRLGTWRLDVLEADGALIRSYSFVLAQGRAGRVGRMLPSESSPSLVENAVASPEEPSPQAPPQALEPQKPEPQATPETAMSPVAVASEWEARWLSFQAGGHVVWQSGSWSASGVLYYNPRLVIQRFELGIVLGYSYLKRDDVTRFSQFEYLASTAYRLTENFSAGIRGGAQTWTCTNCTTSAVVGPHLEHDMKRGWLGGIWASYLFSFRDPSSSAASVGLRFEAP